MAYRSRLDIQASILESARMGAAKTRLMYGANLSYFQTIAYLNELSDLGFLEQSSVSRTYRTSQKGIEFLDSYKKLCCLINA